MGVAKNLAEAVAVPVVTVAGPVLGDKLTGNLAALLMLPAYVPDVAWLLLLGWYVTK